MRFRQSSGIELTPFQVQCQRRVEEILHSHELHFSKTAVEGEEEDYLVLDVRVPSGTKLQVYVYEDEAGFFEGGEWHIWEKPDHSDADLVERFLEGLRYAIRRNSASS